MKDPATWFSNACPSVSRLAAVLGFSVALLIQPAAADELRAMTGERIVGKVLSANEKSVVFESAALGRLTIARSNVMTITLGPVTATNAAPAPGPQPPTAALTQPALAAAAASTNDYSALLRSLPAQPDAGGNMSDLLAQSGPEATARFNQMVRGLVTGSLSMEQLRAEAKSVADQARALRSELDEDSGAILDGYLAILDKFLGQSTPQSQPQPKPSPAK